MPTLTQYRVYEQVASKDVNAPSTLKYRGAVIGDNELTLKQQIDLAKANTLVKFPIIEQE